MSTLYISVHMYRINSQLQQKKEMKMAMANANENANGNGNANGNCKWEWLLGGEGEEREEGGEVAEEGV